MTATATLTIRHEGDDLCNLLDPEFFPKPEQVAKPIIRDKLRMITPEPVGITVFPNLYEIQVTFVVTTEVNVPYLLRRVRTVISQLRKELQAVNAGVAGQKKGPKK